MKKILRFLTSRVFIFSFLILFQIALLIVGMLFLSGYYQYFAVFMQVLSVIMVIYIISRRDNPMFKIAWIIPIMLVPIVGGLFYLLFGKRNISKKIRRYMEVTAEETQKVVQGQPKDVLEEIKFQNMDAYQECRYIMDKALAPVFKNTYTKFLSPGEQKWEYMLRELKKAQNYIFLEYFIIEDGVMWQSILDILRQKVKEGVCVKLIYDDLGSIQTLNADFPKQMYQYGIECRIFNPFHPSPDVFMNYRDHRKICVIDGNVGFTGGINLADEYINGYEKHGYWKDSSIILKGDAVWTLTIMFLQIWGHDSLNNINYLEYKPEKSYPTDGYVQPFGDSPIDDDLVGENAYMNIIHHAKEYVYITTPYLILDNEMTTALTLAAQSGVDVRIITPHVPDKWFVHAVTRANYDVLVDAGVKIYEYTPGFIHAKTIVSDHLHAIVGTMNFDFRSFYLHFECGVYLYRTSSVLEVRDDFLKTQEQSEQITKESCKNVPFFVRIVRSLLRVFSPLM